MTKRKVPSKPTREQTAYHEAGHCIAALTQQLRFDHVTIKKDKDSRGSIVHPNVLGYEHSGQRERRSIARACIIVSYAGLEAEKLFNPAANESLSGDDCANAFSVSREYGVTPRHCDYIGDDAHVAYLHRLRSEARRLVQRNWWAVKALARALLQRQTLNHKQAQDIILQAGGTTIWRPQS